MEGPSRSKIFREYMKNKAQKNWMERYGEAMKNRRPSEIEQHLNELADKSAKRYQDKSIER